MQHGSNKQTQQKLDQYLVNHEALICNNKLISFPNQQLSYYEQIISVYLLNYDKIMLKYKCWNTNPKRHNVALLSNIIF